MTTNQTQPALAVAYAMYCHDIVRTYPAQAVNVDYYANQIATSKVGVMNRNAHSKGKHSSYTKGDAVLVLKGASEPGFTTIWKHGESCMSVPSDYVSVAR